MTEYTYKSPEKSSPSFPEDADDEDDECRKNSLIGYNCPLPEDCVPVDSPHDDMVTDITMTAEDDDDDVDGTKPISSCVDSPKTNCDSSDKKVHWTTRNVQALLDCVEGHLNEFNVQKKHKAVWQTIGVEMEPLGFSTEHCYNKWKNLRRDVRLLVNNPLKAVRNAHILRRVAGLILVIYPNVDASTMQVCGDRSGVKSTPATPGGPCNSTKMDISNMHFSGLNSPHDKNENINLPHQNGGSYNFSDHLSIHSTPNTVEKGFSRSIKSNIPAPATALFGGKPQCSQNGDMHHNSANNFTQSRLKSEDDNESSPATLPFSFNPAAAALLLQSQLLSDFFKQQRKQDVLTAQDLVRHLTSTQNGSGNAALQQTLFGYQNDFSGIPNISTVSMTASLLNNLVSLTTNPDSRFQIQDNYNTVLHNLSANILDCVSHDSEIAGVVERLQAEEAVQFRLTDMIVHLADELRAAGQRRQSSLNQLFSLMKGVGFGRNSQSGTTDTNGIL